MIEELREKIKDYYGTAMMLFPAAMEEIERVERMSDKEVLEEARRLHLIH